MGLTGKTAVGGIARIESGRAGFHLNEDAGSSDPIGSGQGDICGAVDRSQGRKESVGRFASEWAREGCPLEISHAASSSLYLPPQSTETRRIARNRRPIAYPAEFTD